MRRSIEEQAEYMLEKTVDMSIDLWQTKECAMSACDICIDAAHDSLDNDLITPIVIYWEKVKQRIQETR